jgi:hypothetical protein
MTARVEVYSSSRYADRPMAVWDDQERLEVTLVEHQWRDPNQLHFLVQVTDGRRLHLAYDLQADHWSVQCASHIHRKDKELQ